MIKPTKFKGKKASAALAGCSLGIAWYLGSSSLVSGTAIPVLGAVVAAGLLPQFLMGHTQKRAKIVSELPLTQHLDAFNRHACMTTTDSHGHLVEVNEKMLELTGYAREDLVGQPVSCLHSETAAAEVAKIRQGLRRAESWEGEIPLVHKDGHEIYMKCTIMPLFDADENFSGSITVRTDVTGTRERIEERQTAETLYELRDAIWIIDAETEKFSYMNRMAQRRFEIEHEVAYGQNLPEVTQNRETAAIFAACARLKKNGRKATRFETKLLGVQADVSIKFLPDAGVAGRYLVLIRDVSENVEQEQKRSAFISTVSHELRSPLTSIKGAMGLLLSQSMGKFPDKAISLLEIAHRNADRLILIINDILDLDKMANGEMNFTREAVDVSALVKEADEATAMLQQRFSVKTELIGIDEPLPFRTDPNRFIQVLTNLLSNAYKFSEKDGTIYIKVTNEAGQIRVSVKDEGVGIPADEQHKIFNRFTDMSNSDRVLKGGTGLGLNICKVIVERMGGTIGFDTVENVGTTFYFCLPKTEDGITSLSEDLDKRRA